MIGERQPLKMRVESSPQIVCYPLPDTGCEVLLGIRRDCIENGNADNGNTGKLQDAEWVLSGNVVDETVQPATGCLGFQNVIQHDL